MQRSRRLFGMSLSAALLAACTSGGPSAATAVEPASVAHSDAAVPARSAFAHGPHIYVANCGVMCGGSNHSTVTVYGPRGTTVQRTISEGLQDPVAMAVDHAGNLYVANRRASNTITVYAAGTN